MAATKTYDECYFINYDSCTDLQLYEIGCHACLPSYSFGPAIRPHYIFHYLTGGKGCLTIENKTYTVKGHEGFLIPPNVLSHYIADQEDPWHYIWIHLDGLRVREYFQTSGLNSSSPVFVPSEHPNNMASIMDDFLSNHDRELYCIGKTFEFFDCLRRFSTNEVESTANYKLAYIKKIIGYIQVNYSIPFHMDALAKACGLERSYMTKLFKNATGSTPLEYVVACRMKQARLMLENGDFSIQNIAYSVGYGDSFTFSKAFKRYVGASPRDYRAGNRGKGGTT